RSAMGSSSARGRSRARVGDRRPHAGGCVGAAVLARDDEAVIGRPRQLDLVAAGAELGPGGPLDVLLVDGERPALRLDLVLRAHAEIRGVADDAGEAVVAGRALRGRVEQPDLLGPDADPDGRL